MDADSKEHVSVDFIFIYAISVLDYISITFSKFIKRESPGSGAFSFYEFSLSYDLRITSFCVCVTLPLWKVTR